MRYLLMLAKLQYADRDISEIFHVSERTARRWRAKGRAPHAVCLVLQSHIYGREIRINDYWHGWYISDERLISDTGASFTPADLRYYAARRYDGWGSAGGGRRYYGWRR